MFCLPEKWDFQIIPRRDQRIPYVICDHEETDHCVVQVAAVKGQQHKR